MFVKCLVVLLKLKNNVAKKSIEMLKVNTLQSKYSAMKTYEWKREIPRVRIPADAGYVSNFP